MRTIVLAAALLASTVAVASEITPHDAMLMQRGCLAFEAPLRAAVQLEVLRDRAAPIHALCASLRAGIVPRNSDVTMHQFIEDVIQLEAVATANRIPLPLVR